MKLAVVAAIIVGLYLARRWYHAYRARLEAHRPDHPRLPEALRNAAAERTWIVFTTPFCANCGPVKEKLATVDPGAHLVTVDATEQPHLADAFHVRSAPTVLLADATGEIKERLIGVAAVNRYLATV